MENEEKKLSNEEIISRARMVINTNVHAQRGFSEGRNCKDTAIASDDAYISLISKSLKWSNVESLQDVGYWYGRMTSRINPIRIREDEENDGRRPDYLSVETT